MREILGAGGGRTRTLHTVNEAANWVSAVAFEQGVPHEYELRKHTYAELKSRGLGAQAAQHVIKKVRDAYTVLKANIGAGSLGGPGSRSSRHGRGESDLIQRDGVFYLIATCEVPEAERTSSGISLEELARKGEAVWTAGRESCVPATP